MSSLYCSTSKTSRRKGKKQPRPSRIPKAPPLGNYLKVPNAPPMGASYPMVKGRGDYKMFGWFGPNVKSKYNSLSGALLGKLRDNAGAIGTAAGNYIAPGIGGQIGGGIGNLIQGSGAYKMNNSVGSSTNTGMGVSPLGIPIFRNRRVGKDVADSPKWRECIGIVNASNGVCVVTSYIIQPSNPTTFPWGSRRGPMYRKYNPHGIIVEFESTSSPIGVTTAALGDVVLFAQSRNDELVPNNAINCMTMAGSVAGNPSQSLLLGIECSGKDRQYNQFYCSDGTTQSVDPSRFDFGTFSICVQCPGATNTQIGRLWISCDFDFIEQIPISTWPNLTSSVVSSLAVTGTACTAAAPLTAPIINSASGITTQVTFPTTTTMTVPAPGVYFLSSNWANSSSITAGGTLGFGSNITPNNLFNAAAQSQYGFFFAALAQIVASFTVTASGVSAANTITFSGFTGMTSSNLSLNLFVIPPMSSGFIGMNELQTQLKTLISNFHRLANPSNLPTQSSHLPLNESKFFVEDDILAERNEMLYHNSKLSSPLHQLNLDEEFKQFLKYREFQIENKRISEIKQCEIDIEDDFDNIPTITSKNGGIYLNPLIDDYRSGVRTSGPDLPKSESFINQVMDLVNTRKK